MQILLKIWKPTWEVLFVYKQICDPVKQRKKWQYCQFHSFFQNNVLTYLFPLFLISIKEDLFDLDLIKIEQF